MTASIGKRVVKCAGKLSKSCILFYKVHVKYQDSEGVQTMCMSAKL